MHSVSILSDTESRTEAIGHAMARHMPNGTVVALHGDLGAGKTVLARGLARGLGILEPVTSPTFTIVQEYARPTGGWLFHLDMYRIATSADALAFGIEEYLFAADAVTVVEWPERIAELLEPEPARRHAAATIVAVPSLVVVHLAHAAAGGRELTFPSALARLLLDTGS